MSKQGFIALSRGLPNHPIVGFRGTYKPSEAWLWLLFEASWKARRMGFQAGRHVGALKLEREQLSHSLRFMASRWGWTVKRVRTFLGALKNDSMITTQTGTGQTVITIWNYDIYQCLSGSKETQSTTQTGTQWARNGHKEEQGNKETKDNTRSSARSDEPEGFAEWYSAYPRRKARQDAQSSYRKLIGSGAITAADLLATRLFADHWKARTAAAKDPKREIGYCPYPSSWLNSGEYADEIEAAPLKPGEMKIEGPTQDARNFTEAGWRDRIPLTEGGTRWPSQWGPKPGEPGCLVPQRLLDEFALPAHASRHNGGGL